MAIFTPGPAVAEVSGSVGGTTFSRNKGGQYMRRRAVPTNPQSTAQTLIRALTAGNSAAWQELDDETQAAWNAFAEEVGLAQYRNALGLDASLSGQQTYVRLNNRLAYAGLSPIEDPPSGEAPAQPQIVFPFVAAPTVEAGVFGVQFTANDSVAAGSDQSWQMGVTTPRGPGRTRYQANELRLVVTTPANGVLSTAGITTDQYVARYGVPAIGAKLGIGVRVIDTSSGGLTPWILAPIAVVEEPE